MSNLKLVPFKVNMVCDNCEDLPYGIKRLEAPRIWQKGEKGAGIVVAILDTGIDRNHPDLAGNIIDGMNFTEEDTPDNYQDYNGHGTHVAGTIGAKENKSGVVGVAPECKLLICKVLDKNGSGSYEGIINGLKYATEWEGINGERVRIINMSLGGSENLPELEEAIKNACAKGIVVVVASGNEGDGQEDTFEFGYPALYGECVTVSAHDEKLKIAPFSNNHLQVDVCASGVQVHSTYLNGGYAILSGTSMATPHVSGALALIIKMNEEKFGRTLTESEIFAQMVRCCVPMGFKPSTEGNGRIRLSFLYKRHLV